MTDLNKVTVRIQAVMGEDFDLKSLDLHPEGKGFSLDFDFGPRLQDAAFETIEHAAMQIYPLVNEILVEEGLRSPDDPTEPIVFKNGKRVENPNIE